MIKWMRPLYRDEKISEPLAAIRYKFKFRKYPGDYYFIILPKDKDMPEIIKAVYLKQPFYKHMDYGIIGIAADKTTALELLKEMIQDVYDACQDVNIRRFYMSQKK